ncbi:MAG: 2-phospho-L-lactate guanylyltransferase [Methanothrix sp.]|uniref:2-phospho-L-lactate guanylyltransferase n=1 Tax=Methanothrix harundinacea TaxID=301375 RepID=A0A101IM56_9EURY|nr:MAG: 2-phospho-L-lactate guanylyltransferase [Methanothrix harundinacea]MDD3710522.1 2-phospho-L-lactate guanylyltransferase [Methanothrix sp.]MDI9399850.1 2-phospho-L-lactate guanylyltransferase [Euryarchaeota archaeon]KUK97771.1 MAG: 2-phospho-L-lactate guanylyltransferase [Methanothrix harundinacea]MCP1392460.1 2-phospho-L-lactate guanylyltransferase [Methanothrix harundinacea]
MRPIRVVIPFKLDCAKSRLSSVLSSEEREGLALAMLEDVIDVVSGLGRVSILMKDPLPEAGVFNRLRSRSEIELIECPQELDPALNSMIEAEKRKGWPSYLLIAMADLPLMRPSDLEGLVRTPGDVVIVPGRGGGTNLILVRDPKFRVSYYGLSFLKHLKVAEELGLSVGVYESFRCGSDIDEPSDLVEVLIHGRGRTPEILRKLGFELSGRREKARAGCHR